MGAHLVHVHGKIWVQNTVVWWSGDEAQHTNDAYLSVTLHVCTGVEGWVVCYCTVSNIGGTPMMIYTYMYMYPLQDGWTALMSASDAGKVECVKVLLDKDAQVNMQHKGHVHVSGVIIHYVHACIQ